MKKIIIELVVDGDADAALVAVERALDDVIPCAIEDAARGTDDEDTFEIFSGTARLAAHVVGCSALACGGCYIDDDGCRVAVRS